MSVRRACTASLRGERGFLLIEVLISSVLLMLVVLGTLTAFDASGHFTVEEQHRSEAADLAQQDQDRLRGLQVSQLEALNQSRTVTINGTPFTIASTGKFSTAATGTSSCSAAGSADLIKTTSTVTWPTIGTRPPVVAESTITPPTGGALIVQVVNSQGAGVPGMSVTGSGVAALSATTGADGCAIFAGLSGGAYSVAVSAPGYVDKDGNASNPQSTTVIVGATVTDTFYYDQAGQINTTFDTKPYGSASAVASSTDRVAVVNNNMTYPGFRWAGTAGTFAGSLALTNVFPFTSAYTVYAGTCAANAPSSFGMGPDPTVAVTQGGSASLLLHLPALNVSVYSGTSLLPGSPVNKPHVVLTDQGCGGSPPTAGGSPPVKRTPTTTSAGRLADPGEPFGTYTVCADNGLVHAQSTGVVNNLLSGTTVNLYLGAGSFGVCT